MDISRLPNESGIYRITCSVTRTVYIGKAEDIRIRISNHKSLLRKGKHPNKYLQNDWNLYGATCFTVRVLKKVQRNIEQVEKKVLLSYLDDGTKLYNIVDLAPTSLY